MGVAYYCDRCGKLYDSTEVKMMKVTILGVFSEPLKADLCVICARGIEPYVWGDDLNNEELEVS